MAKAAHDKRKNGSRRKKKAGQRKWQDRVWENVKIALVALPYAAVYLSANALVGCTIVRGEINENIFLLFIVLPVLLLPIRSWLSGIKDWSSLLFNAILGLFAGTALYYLSITVWLGSNYLISRSESYERKAVVYGMKTERRYRQAYHNYITLRFTDNGEWYRYDGDYKEYEAIQTGDTCIITIRDGVWGYSVIKNLQPAEKSSKLHRDIRSLLEFLKEGRGNKNIENKCDIANQFVKQEE